MTTQIQRRSFIGKTISLLPGLSILEGLSDSTQAEKAQFQQTAADRVSVNACDTLALPSCTEHLHADLALKCLRRIFWNKPIQEFRTSLRLSLGSIETILVDGLAALSRQQMDAMRPMVQSVISRGISRPRIFASTALLLDVTIDRRTSCRVYPPEGFVLQLELEDEVLVETARTKTARYARFTLALRENHPSMYAVMMKALGQLDVVEVVEQVRQVATNTSLEDRIGYVQGLIAEWSASLKNPRARDRHPMLV